MSDSSYRVSEQNAAAIEDSGVEQVSSRIISKILSPAVRLWLRSQIESAEALQFQIEGSDRQILSGHIPRVAIAAENAVYQGIAISQIRAVGEGIRVNLREVLRGKPLRLIDVVPVQAEAKLTEADLNASLQTPLLSNALTNLLLDWLRLSALDGLPESLHESLQDTPVSLHPSQIMFREAQLVLSGTLRSARQQILPFTLRTGLQVIQGTKLRLDRPQWLDHPQSDQGQPLPQLHGLEIDLGTEVNLQQLAFQDGQMICRGSINVLP